MERRLVIAGIGGQGVVYATKVLSRAALARGERVMASENHGMSQRGGSVMSHLKFGGDEAPLIRRGAADVLLAFDRVEAVRNLLYVRAGGCVFVNSRDGLEPAVMGRLSELGIGVFAMDADAAARELGATAAMNLVLIGFAAAHSALGVGLDELCEAVRAIGPARAVEVNLRALELGAGVTLTPGPSPALRERGEG